MVQERGGETAAPFIVGCASDFFKGDTALAVEFGHDEGADLVFVFGAVADFLRRPVHVDAVGGEAEVVRYSQRKEVFFAVDEAAHELLGRETQKLGVREGDADGIEANGIENAKSLAHVDKFVRVVDVEDGFAKGGGF